MLEVLLAGESPPLGCERNGDFGGKAVSADSEFPCGVVALPVRELSAPPLSSLPLAVLCFEKLSCNLAINAFDGVAGLFADNNDEERFSAIPGKYHIFYKDICIQENINNIPVSAKTKTYVINGIIQKELTKSIRNKKYEYMVYLLQNSDKDRIKENIIAKIVPSLKNTMSVDFKDIDDI